MYYLQ